MNIQTPFGKIFKGNESIFEDFSNPFIIKPNREGSSVGFFIINNRKEMLKAIKYNKNNDIIFEDFIKGRELTVSVLNDKVLPIVEIIPKSGVYDYSSKYTAGKSSYIVPAKIDASVEKEIKEKSLAIFNEIGCKDYSRIDYILSDENIPYFLEVNTNPGLTEESILPQQAKAAGISLKELFRSVIDINE